MRIWEQIVPGYEQVLFAEDGAAGYRAIIAIHSTTRGPALGGIRCWNYNSDEEALEDVLRLAKGMTYKNALADLPLGGGKSVIVGNHQSHDRDKIFRAHGYFINSLAGKYITAEDVGTGPEDMEYVRKATSYVVGLRGGAGDPSPSTAYGTLRAMQAASANTWGTDDLSSRVVAVQGCGHVGLSLVCELQRRGAKLLVADVDPKKVKRATAAYGATAVPATEIFSTEAEIFAPCALGGVVNDESISQLKSKIICGAANNQLLESRHGDALEQLKRTYVPDYAANAGGVISLAGRELLGWDLPTTIKKIDGIYDTVLHIFALAKKYGIPSYKAADKLAEERMHLVPTGIRTPGLC